jgi:hypothetical protein
MPPTGPEASPRQDRLTSRVAAAGAAVAQTTTIGDSPYDATVAGVSYEPDAAINGAATNNRTFNLLNRGQDGTGVTVVATLTFAAGTNIAAGDEGALALSGTPANLSVNQGDVLALQEVINGTGLANPGGLCKVTLNRR